MIFSNILKQVFFSLFRLNKGQVKSGFYKMQVFLKKNAEDDLSKLEITSLELPDDSISYAIVIEIYLTVGFDIISKIPAERV